MSSQNKYNVPTATLIDGTHIPLIAWGNGTGGLAKDLDLAAESGTQVLKAGIKHIDTAQSYGTEEQAAIAVKQAGVKREDYFLTTKISKSDTTPEAIRSTIQASLSKLGTKPNLLLVHNPYVPARGKIGEFWKILEGLVKDGTLEGVSLGVSNFRPQDLEEVWKVATIKPAVHQIEYHPYVLSHLEPILSHAAANGTIIESYGPLTPLLRHPTGGPIKPILEKIAERLSKESGKSVDAAAALLKWTIQKGVVAVTSSKNESRIAQIAAVQSLPDLTPGEVEEIEETGKKIHFRHYTEHLWEDFPVPDLPKDL